MTQDQSSEFHFVTRIQNSRQKYLLLANQGPLAKQLKMALSRKTEERAENQPVNQTDGGVKPAPYSRLNRSQVMTR